MADEMTKVSLRIDDSEKKALLFYAGRNDLNLSQVIRKAIREFLYREFYNKEI